MLKFHKDRGWHAWVVRLGIISLTLATAYIHYTLGGLMFLANAAGYAGFALLMAAPLEIASRYRWLTRVGLIGFTVGTIVAWQLFGARFWLGYLDKGIEIVLVVLLGLEIVHYDGGPLAVARKAWHLAVDGAHRLTGTLTNVFRLAMAMLLLAGCGTARPMISPPPNAVIVSAAGDAFTDSEFWAPAGTPFTVYFQITDFTQHNLQITNEETGVSATEVFGGPSARTLEVPALASGDFLVLTCDVHPGMWASLEAW